VHRTEESLLLCYVGHHDEAYRWAERRKLETHPKTGAAQLVEIRETVKEIVIPQYVEAPEKPAAPIFAHLTDEDLLAYGVPEEWLEDARHATEDSVLELADHLPKEAAEALLEIATGGRPEPSPVSAEGESPFEHPDAMRRFRVMENVEELERQHPEARVLLTTFSDTLARALEVKLRRMVGNEPKVMERIEVHGMATLGRRLYTAMLEAPRMVLWGIYERLREDLEARDAMTEASMFGRLTERLLQSKSRPYDYAVIDEAQDVGVPQLRFLAALGGETPDGLFFAGDLGQRIFQPPFSWKSLGIDIRGRSRTLRINYRTSHQIPQQADRLLGPEVSDVDGNTEIRRGTVSVFNGPVPVIRVFDD